MAVRKRGNKWHYDFMIDDVRYRGAIKTARTKRQAEDAERKKIEEVHEGEYGKPKGKTRLMDFVTEDFLPWSKKNKKSWRDDVYRTKPIIEFFKDKTFREITPSLVEKYRDQRHDSISKRGTRRNVATVNRELQLLSRIFTLAMEKKETRSNPCAEVDLLKGEVKRTRHLFYGEKQRLLDALSNPRRSHVLMAVELDLNTGLRRGELLSLRVEDVDFYRNLVRVDGKTGPREVPINARAREILASLVEQARQNDWKYLFTNPKTGTRYKDLKKAFHSALREAGIEGFRFHDLRHTFGTRAGDDPQVNIPALAEVMGHKNWRTTMRYTHATDEGKRRVVEAQGRESAETTSQICHKPIGAGLLTVAK
jgi:integrase